MDITGEDDGAGPKHAVVRHDALAKRLHPVVFGVPLHMYPYQPWTSRTNNLAQWFNYGLTPATWTAYAQRQMQWAHAKATSVQ